LAFGQTGDVDPDAKRIACDPTDGPPADLELQLDAIVRIGQQDGIVGKADVLDGRRQRELTALTDGDEQPKPGGDGERPPLEVPVSRDERRQQAPSLSLAGTAGGGTGATGTPSINS